MAQKVNGYLSVDGVFFNTFAECERHEYERKIRELCDSHEVNSHNFFKMLNHWSKEIRGYYHADSQCEQKRAEAEGRVLFEDPSGPLPQAEGDNEDEPVGEEDVETLQQFEARRHIGVSDVWRGPRTETIPAARSSAGPGSGGVHASSLRIDEVVATPRNTEPA